jgi:hypothetical protein
VKILALMALVMFAGCRAPVAPGAESFVPAGSAAVGGVDMAGLRGSALYAKIAPLMQSYGNVRSVLLAYRGNELLAIADGKPAGPANLVQAAEAQHATRRSGVPELLAQAPRDRQIWVVVRGGVSLPLTGNYANVNRLLRDMEYASVGMRVGSQVEVELRARGRTEEAARHFEGTFRATLTLIAAGESKNAELATVLRSILVKREDREVSARVSLAAEDVGKWF